MKENTSALFSEYIINGIRYETTPAQLLGECTNTVVPEHDKYADIVDESTDPPINSFVYDSSSNEIYLQQCVNASEQKRDFRMLYPESFTRLLIARSLIERIWNDGHFRIGDLSVWAQWEWNTRPVGSMAAFYMSVSSASDYLFELGIKLNDFAYEEVDECCCSTFHSWIADRDEMDESSDEPQLRMSPYESSNPWIKEGRLCPCSIIPDEDSSLIYIPFDTCQHKLGGSLLAQVNGHNGGSPLQLDDSDYFIDCYEVVRELIEDGIVLSGVTVADGGLATAAARICKDYGLEMDINGVISSYQEHDSTKILFAEIPGVILQIRNSDLNYLDVQLLLQDVAYYIVGSPSLSKKGIGFNGNCRKNIADIIESLLDQATEGED